jgi:glutathione S-transferase
MQGRQGDETVLKQQLEKMEKILDIYEAHLSKNKYFAGDLSHIPHTFDLVNMAKKGDEFTSRKHVCASLKMSLKMLLKMSWKTVTAKTNAKA